MKHRLRDNRVDGEYKHQSAEKLADERLGQWVGESETRTSLLHCFDCDLQLDNVGVKRRRAATSERARKTDKPRRQARKTRPQRPPRGQRP